MIYAVFLCDKQWKIKKVRQCCPELDLKEGESLTNLISEKWALEQENGEQYTLQLSFLKQEGTIPAVIHSYKDASLVVLASINSNQEFVEFGGLYPTYQEWAKTHIFGLFHDEYYMIQQINNQLVDAKRRLTRSNRQLEYALRENKEITEKLDEARVLAERANDSKTKFLANMSHDIRTPMNAIVGLAELMQHHLGEPEILKTYLSKLRSSSGYLLDLINDILDLSKIESGSIELRMEPMDIGAQIEQVVTIMRPQMDKKKQKLSVQCDCKEFGTVLGDPVRFRQILMNIFSNAVKYTPKGGKIDFAIREVERTEKEKKYKFQIKDSGIGMTPEFMQHIFDPFVRAEADVKEIQGTGLGMAITKSLIDAMGGTIQVDSTLGKGSCFCIELSCERCADQALTGEADEQQTGGPMDLHGMNFLCAEDNELNAEILAAMLEVEGAKCTIYENGKALAEAFESVKPGDYDVILMDVQMPVMNGYEASRAIRTSPNPLGREIPIIAMTANAFAEDIRRCLDAGMNAHIAKPVDFDKLKEVLQKIRSQGSKMGKKDGLDSAAESE